MKQPFVIIAMGASLLAGCQSGTTQPLAETTPSTAQQDMQVPTRPSVAPVSCGYTAPTTAGPYYVSGMPELEDGNLNYANLSGRELELSGFVYVGLDESQPVANAVIDIWQTDTEGVYYPTGSGDVSDYTEDELALRGYVTTDETGYYEFTTIYPGEYTGRTRHIHIKVRAPGHEELTTQLIVPGITDRDVDFDQDTIAQSLPTCHLLAIYDEVDPAYATYDFRLQP